jgi:hypothetical protein
MSAPKLVQSCSIYEEEEVCTEIGMICNCPQAEDVALTSWWLLKVPVLMSHWLYRREASYYLFCP